MNNDNGKFMLVDGTYLTSSQHKFIANIQQSDDAYKELKEYLTYFDLCRIYNIVSDEYNKDNDVCSFYWDDENECMSFSFVKGSMLDEKIVAIRKYAELV